jgi:hypothetical protein
VNEDDRRRQDEAEQRRLALIRESTRVPEPAAPGWSTPTLPHPALEGEQRARIEAQRRRAVIEMLRSVHDREY